MIGEQPDPNQPTPMILAGAGSRAGATAHAWGADVAPTLAALLGVPFPAQAQGGILTQILSGPELTADWAASASQLALFYESWSEILRQPRFATELLRRNAVYPAYLSESNARASAQREAAIRQERTQRGPLLAGVGLGFGIGEPC